MAGKKYQSTEINKTDYELIRDFKNGDESAFSQIVLRYQKRLVQIAYAVMFDEDEAKDMVQETFIKAYFNLKSFREESSLYTWLYRILYNHCISSLRRKKLLSFLSFDSGKEVLDFPSKGPDPEENIERKEIMSDVKEALKKLPAKQRMIFAMKQLDGLKHEEIANALGLTEGAVKASYFHAVRKLREILKHYRGSYEL